MAYLLFVRDSGLTYYVHSDDYVEVIPDLDNGIRDANGESLSRYISREDWVFKDDVINAIEKTGYVVIDGSPKIVLNDIDDVDNFDWYPAVYFWAGGNYKIIVGDEVEEIEVLDEEVLKRYRFGTILKIKYKDEYGDVKTGFVNVSSQQGSYPLYYDTLEELEEDI